MSLLDLVSLQNSLNFSALLGLQNPLNLLNFLGLLGLPCLFNFFDFSLLNLQMSCHFFLLLAQKERTYNCYSKHQRSNCQR